MTAQSLAFPAPGPSSFHAARQLVSHLRTRQPLAPPAWLSSAEAALFARLPPADQLEGLAVVASLESWGWSNDRELLVAGLLHDLGKCLASPSAGYRVAVTLLEAIAPSALPAVAQRSSAIAALVNHAAAGAALAAEAGLPEGVVHLIAEHHRPVPDARMAALQQADRMH